MQASFGEEVLLRLGGEELLKLRKELLRLGAEFVNAFYHNLIIELT